MSTKLEVNERIHANQVRVIDETGAQKGVMSFRDALNYARSLNLDLVKIADANPPVCRVVDSGKYLYEQQKQQKLMAKKQRAAQVDVKEVQLRSTTDVNDIKIKAKKARGFLADGDQVKVVLRFKGREITHKDVGRGIINQFIAEIGEHKVERALQEAGNQLIVILAPAQKPAK